MKKFLIIIGLTLLVGIQITNADDCTSTLYKDEFSCKSQKAYSYCSSNVSRKNVKYNLYESAYCNSEINNTDKVYEAVANQLVAEDPQWDKKLVKGVLINLTQYGIDEYLKDKYSSTDSNTISKLPKAIQEVYRGGQIGQQAKIYKRIKRAYDKQRVIQHGQESLKQQFKAREMWANASLNDSPFDLVVDLNLIEIMLFGNKAKWTSENDVWSWPEDEEEKKKKSKIPNSSPKQSKAGSPTTPSAKPTTSSTANEYECVADKTTKKPTSNPGIVPKNCGNKKLEKGEECDDGNTVAGDGCSESCKKEKGASLQCKDTGTITFKTFKVKPAVNKSTSAKDAKNSIPLSCPPGSTATKKTPADKKVTQSPNYPGPFIGGVLKKFPPSKKSKCPPGMKWTQIKFAGITKGTCFPVQFCADAEKTREFLFGKGYKKDSEKEPIAAAIEVSICINIEQIKVPESPYSVEDGCIDCHIMAMNDAMKKMLEKGVIPKQNTTQAWGTSNRWGPSFTFNLHTAVKRPETPIIEPKNMHKGIGLLEPEKAASDKYFLQKQQDAHNKKDLSKEQAQPAPVVTRSMESILSREKEQAANAQKKILQSLKNYRVTSGASADQDTHRYLTTLLNALKKSFGNLTNQYMDMALASKFADKKQCKF